MKSLVLLLLVSCVENPEATIDHDYLVQTFGKTYVCEDYKDYRNAVHLKDCANVLDSKDVIKELMSAVNFIEVGDLK